MEIEVRTKEQQAIDNLKAIVNSKDKIIEIEPPIEDTAQILLDCIINLQTIEQQYSAILSENAELENKITNLQEENEKLKQENKDKIEYLCDLVNEKVNLQEENQTLKNQLDFIEEQNHIIDKLEKEIERLKLELSGYREAILRDDKLLGLQEYKQRNKKAIEYCKKSNLTLKSHYFSDLLNILGGDDNGNN